MGRTSDRFKETIIRVGLKSGQLCQEYERVGMYPIWRLVEGYQHLDLVSWEIWLIYEEDNPRRMIKIKEWYELIPPSWYQGGSRSPSWQGMGLWEAEDEGRGMLVRYLRQETPLKEQGRHGTGKYSFVVFSDHFTGQARYFIFVGMRSLSATTIPDKFLCSSDNFLLSFLPIGPISFSHATSFSFHSSFSSSNQPGLASLGPHGCFHVVWWAPFDVTRGHHQQYRFVFSWWCGWVRWVWGVNVY